MFINKIDNINTIDEVTFYQGWGVGVRGVKVFLRIKSNKKIFITPYSPTALLVCHTVWNF